MGLRKYILLRFLIVFYCILFFCLFLIQLACLNLSNNRIHKLDDLADVVTKVPNLKALNLSQNEVRRAAVVSK